MADVNINAGEIASIRFNEQAGDISSPAAGYWSIYVKSGGLFTINESGVINGPLAAADGWIAAGETWTYAAADDPTL